MDWQIVRSFPDLALERAWLGCLGEADVPSHYASPAFFREPFFDANRPFAILAGHQGQIAGVLCGFHEGNHVLSGLISRPQICFRLRSDPVEVGAALARGLAEEAVGSDLVTVFTWSPLEEFRRRGYRCQAQEGVVVLDLAMGPEPLFKGFSDNRKTNIRKAMRLGVEVFQAETPEEFSAYYSIYVDWSRRKRLPTNDYGVMEGAFRLRNNRRLFLARSDGKIVAGLIVRFCPGGLIEYAANSSTQEGQRLRANDLLHWRVIEWACREGFPTYSLGGAHLFLRKFGGPNWPTYRHRLDLTWLRRHHAREAVKNTARKAFRMLPGTLQSRVRKILGQEVESP